MRQALFLSLVPFLITSFLGVLAPQGAEAAVIHQGLSRQLESLEENDLVSIILIMRDQAPIAAINEELKRERATRSVRHERVVIALHEANSSQADLLATLAENQSRGEVAGFTSYWIANLVVAQVTKAYVYVLAERNDIAAIESNFTPALIAPVEEVSGAPGEPHRGIGITPGLRAINADSVWSELGITGAGRLIGGLDTGVDGEHPALADRWRGACGHPAGECWLNLIDNGHPDFPYDTGQHGTHTMGTMTGLGEATGDTIGVAWGALWIACDAIGQVVNPDFDNDIITAFQWFADPDGDPSTTDDVPDVVQNSWGVCEQFPGYVDCDTRWWDVIDHCEAAGVVVCWSAGNEGSAPQTIRSPADRNTTPTNAFSVGAVDATNYTFPYPIAGFSSRGPSGCDGVTIKPEVTAPGVDVYSSVPGGIYQQNGWSGTSMAGPHVAGVVALMREANPDLAVDTIKQILMETAVDHGDPGEDNDYGWGVIDAYAAVTAVMSGFGTVTGTVTNASNGGTPVHGMAVEVLEALCSTYTGTTGGYAISLPAGLYTLTATHPSFTPETAYDVLVEEDQTTIVDFSVTDIGGPEITNTTQHPSTDNTTGPYSIETTVTDFSEIDGVWLCISLNGGDWSCPYAMTPLGDDRYQAEIPGQPYVTHIEYSILAADIAGNESHDPPGGPPEAYDFYVAPMATFLEDGMEMGAADWTHAAVTAGFSDQWHLSTQRNHTPGGDTSWKCGDAGPRTYNPLLDAALATPPFELGIESYLHYWQWIDAEEWPYSPGEAFDGGLVEISVDGGDWEQVFPDSGYTHCIRLSYPPGPFEPDTPVFSGQNDWHAVNVDLSAYAGTAQIRFRFGSNGGGNEGEGWYVDDVLVRGFYIDYAEIGEPSPTRVLLLHGADPNPFANRTSLRYQLPSRADVRLHIFDLGGRLVRTLSAGPQQPGIHKAIWDGRDDSARPLPSGVYLTRLQAGTQSARGKVMLMR
ncbi:MAG: S8 family serine peptidase [Candidatus Eisenbacteria sp.]|nr:S8 family serine peptidase [Candidatus Eisenbacteria bacterium]